MKILLVFLIMLNMHIGYAKYEGKMTVPNPSISNLLSEYLGKKAIVFARDKNVKVSIAICDSAGNLIYFTRMDNAGLITIDVAIKKAKSAAYLGFGTEVFEKKINQGEVGLNMIQGHLFLAGGVPIIKSGQIIGAVGVSGGSPDIDKELAYKIAKEIK